MGNRKRIRLNGEKKRVRLNTPKPALPKSLANLSDNQKKVNGTKNLGRPSGEIVGPLKNLLSNDHRGRGRPPGAQNKTPRSIKDAIFQALNIYEKDGQQGMVAYFCMIRDNHPNLMISLVRRILPVQIKADIDPESETGQIVQLIRARRALEQQKVIDVTPGT